MALLETATWTEAEWKQWLDECFRCWLNRVDAKIGYDERRTWPVSEWRELFDDGECENDAIATLSYGQL